MADIRRNGKRRNGGGFLPIRTNLFDRIFIGVVIFVAIHLFWMRFLEAHISLYVATAISLVVGWIIARRG
jgi:predicted small integral membrane protein